MAPQHRRAWLHPRVNHTAQLNQLRHHLGAMSDPDHIRQAAHHAAGHLVDQSQQYLPEEHSDLPVRVFHTADNVHFGVHPSDEDADRAKRVEWGDHDEAPRAPLRTTVKNHGAEARRQFSRNLGAVR